MKIYLLGKVHPDVTKTFLRKMKITCLMLLMSVSSIFANHAKSQVAKVNITARNASISNVLKAVEQQTDYLFVYNKREVDLDRKVDVDAENETVAELLSGIFQNTNVIYAKEGDNIMLIYKDINSQQLTIKGKITDITGNSLPGVNVVEKGTSNGTVTDLDGQYSISISSPEAILSFSYVGYLTEEIEIAGKTTIDITLIEDIQTLDEVVVIGYGSQKKRDVIGSIASIKSDVIESTSGVSNFTSLLQGQAVGASVQASSGRLGASVNVKIRGLSSISAGTSPLWIIDGVPIISGASTGAKSMSELSPFSLINQADIESIEVLKDAAATSIYGSRGSNGVIIITTKTGKKGKLSVNLDVSSGISDLPSQKVGFANTRQWFEIRDGQKNAYNMGDYTMDDYYNSSAYVSEKLTREQAEANQVDWFKEGLRRGGFQNYNISLMGGSENSSFFVSANYRKDKGVILTDDLERYGLRINLDSQPSKNFKTGAKINFSLSNSSRGTNNFSTSYGNSNSVAGGFSFLNYQSTPFNPVYSPENPKEYFNPYLGNLVAYSDPDCLVQDVEMYRGLANVYGEYAFPFLTDLAVRTELSVDFVQANRNTWVSDIIRYDGPFAQDVARTSRTFNYNAYLKYDNIIGEHSFNAVGGFEAQSTSSWFREMEGEDLVGSYPELGTPNQFNNMYSGLDSENYLLAYFGRANYKYNNKYLAGVSVRRDGSSVFTPEYRWGIFLAFSAGWIISEEAFMGNFGENNFLKLRGSFGQTGNANITSGLDASKYLNGLIFGSQDLAAANGTLVSSIGVSDLTWETTNNSDIGLDYGFNNNRINGSLAYYNKYVEDLLLAADLPYSSGIRSIYGNIGDLVNKGVEFNISAVNVDANNFRWQTTFNITYNHNEVKKLVPKVDQEGTGMISSPYITKVGYPVRDFYLADFAEVDPQTGLSMIYALDDEYYEETGETQRLTDENGEYVLLVANNSNASDNKFHIKNKNTIPKYFGGVTNKLTYKGLDFSFLVTFSGGNYIYDEQYRNLVVQSNTGQIPMDLYENHWKKPGDVAKYQRLNWNSSVVLEDGTNVTLGDQRFESDQWLYKGDYIKLKSITLGYSLPQTSATSKLFNNMRMYMTLENLYTITDYPGWDPEGLGYVRLWDLPQLFSATFGVSVKF